MKDSDKVKKFCSRIHSTDYPISLKELRGISKKTKSTLLETISEYQRDHEVDESGYVESELIKRFLNPSTFLNRNIQTVDGPVSIYQMSHPTLPQIFYLFGDVHLRVGGCSYNYPIAEWIKDTITSSPVFIDVYVEDTYHYKNYPIRDIEYTDEILHGENIGTRKSRHYLDDMNVFSEKCLKKFKNDTMCQTSRFHYIDLRFIFETETQLRGYLIFGSEDPESAILMLDKYEKSYIDDINSYLKFIRNKDSFLYKRIRKQISNIKDRSSRKIIEQSFEKCLERRELDFGYFEPSWSITPKFIEKMKTKELILSRFMSVIDYGMCLMDHYIMARCFRDFKKRSGKYSRPSYNNIIYTGDAHTKDYVSILKKLGFIIDYEQTNYIYGYNSQCLVFDDNFIQPMFHQRYY